MSIIWTGLAPHPPIIVPAVGGDRALDAVATIEGMRALAQDVLAQKAERLVLISPHTPRPPSGVAIWDDPWLDGHFAQFGAPDARFRLPVDRAWTTTFRMHYSPAHPLRDSVLDHGATVPLHFLVEAGWSGPTTVIGLPRIEAGALESLGRAVRDVCAQHQGRTALLASGDMSHVLKADGPYGFDPQGPKFDQAFVANIRQGAYRDVLHMDEILLDEARQDVVGSCHVVWAATDFADADRHFYAYEGPFGVGYTVMRFWRRHD